MARPVRVRFAPSPTGPLHIGGVHEFSCRLGDGPAARDLRGSIGPLSDESGDDSLFLLTLIDRTQEMMTERNLRRELVSDSLTGLPNRAGFEELVEQRSTEQEAGDHALRFSPPPFARSAAISIGPRPNSPRAALRVRSRR